MIKWQGAVICALLGSGAQGEPQPAVLELMPYMDATLTCLAKSDSPARALDCIGQGATSCMESEQDGYTTVGMMFCLLAEAEAWDRVLNDLYGPMIQNLAAADAQEAEVFGDQFSGREDALRAAQRAWITFRDAECGLAYALWGSGSMRQIAGAQCLRDLTAERAIDLKFLGAEQRG